MTVELRVNSPIAEVGDAFSGWVHRDALGGQVSSIQLSLQCRTEGRGDTETATVDYLQLPVESDGSLSSPFTLRVPPLSPISYDGSLIRVIYEIEAETDVLIAGHPKVEKRVLVVLAGGQELYDRPHPLPSDRALPE